MASAERASAGPVVFPLPQGPAPVQVFGLWRPQTALEEPLQRQHWLFWVVPGRQIHAERRSMGLNPLTRAHGPGGPAEHLAAQLLRAWAQQSDIAAQLITQLADCEVMLAQAGLLPDPDPDYVEWARSLYPQNDGEDLG